MKIHTLLTAVLATIWTLGIPRGRCPKCGLRFHGWALRNPRHQSCPKCGRGLEIINSNGTISKGYSPFDADKHPLKSPENVVHPEQEDKDSDVKDD